MRSLGKDTITTIEAYKAADNEALTGAGVDMLGWDGVLFIVGVEDGEALDCEIKVQQGSDSTFSDAADLEGSKVEFSTTATADGVAVVDIYKPQERYVRAVVTVPNANAAKITWCTATRYGAKYSPPTTGVAELHASPGEGTA